MNHIDVQYYMTPAGEFILGSYEERLCLADWHYRKTRQNVDARLQLNLHAEYIEKDSETLVQAKEQLDEYFHGKREIFDIPLLTVGTDFQKSVWQELRRIPYGETLSYLELSKRVGNEKAVRAVASAVGLNALSLFIPCHRVIGSDGSLRGYAGGLRAKKKLMALESRFSRV